MLVVRLARDDAARIVSKGNFMLVLYKDVRCPICNGNHDLCLEERSTIMTYRPRAFVCPIRGGKIQWRPDVFAHRTPEWPESSVPLVPNDSTQEASI